MGEVMKRWSVTYTKHLKQKRKVYQDGSLHLLSNSKVMLYDESEQLLDSKFLMKDEIVKSGESLQFASFLVDIGDPETITNIISSQNLKSECGDITGEETGLCKREKLTAHHSKGKLHIVRKKTSAINISPSQKIIRDFKRNELFKYEVHQTCSPPSTASYTFTEWEVLYTTQITKKAKKYHDGFLRVVKCGSQGRQVTLYDSSKNQLDKRFLKRDEVLSSGESLTFDTYLVDIGDCIGNEDDIDVKKDGRKCQMSKTYDTDMGQQWHKLSEDNQVSNARRIKVTAQEDQFMPSDSTQWGKSQHNACSSRFVNTNRRSLGGEMLKPGKTLPCHMPLRDASQILSILRKPRAIEKSHIVEEAPAKQCLAKSSKSVEVDRKHPDSQASLDTDQVVDKTKGSSNNKEKPANSQGIQVVESSVSESPSKGQQVVGSSLLDRLQANAQGTSVIRDSTDYDFAAAANIRTGLSPVKSEADCHQSQPRPKLPETNSKSELPTSLSIELHKRKCSADDCRYIGLNVSIENSNATIDLPGFDLGI